MAKKDSLEERIKKLKANYFESLWLEFGDVLNLKQKDSIALAYLKNIIGVSDKTIKSFMNGWLSASHSIGLRQGNVKPRKSDYPSFWNEIAKITPEAYSQEDLKWLIKNASDGPFYMLLKIHNSLKGEYSNLIDNIMVNAHAYK